MTTIADIAARTSVVLIAGLALRAMLIHRSAAVRHAVLGVALLAAGLVVPASLVVPTWTFTVPAVSRPEPEPPRPVAAAHGGVAIDKMAAVRQRERPVAALVWAGGFAIGLAVLAAGAIRLRRLVARGRRVSHARWIELAGSVAATYGLGRGVVLVETDAPFLVATWGVRPARVLLPPAASRWTDQRIHAVLCHELAHVARADWLVQIGAHLALSALWFNPLAWLACRQLRRESEQACDDAVLDRGVDASDYAGHLVALARDCRRPSWSSWMPALPMARPSAFERRIAAMLNPRVDRSPLSRRTVAACAAALAAVTLAAAAAHAVQTPAALSGTVYDVTGGVMPGVTLKLEDARQNAAQSVTDASGRFAFPGIGPGQYVLSAALSGFRALRAEVSLNTAADWDRAITLQVGTVQETISVSATRVTAGGAPAAPVRVRIGGNVRAPRKTLDVKPVYPDSMRAAGREAQVQLDAIIDRDGSVSSVRVLTAQIHPDFAIAAADAVRQWQFTPTLLNGQPVAVVMTVSVTFSLSD